MSKGAGRPARYKHGLILCHNCRRYLAPDAFRWQTCPSLPKPKYTAYCAPCQRALDRLRWTGERRDRLNARRVVNQRRQSKREQAERRRFVADAIGILRRRGLTQSEIARLAGVSCSSVAIWARGDRRATPAVAQRFGVVLRETGDLPATDVPPKGNRWCRHPRFAEAMARCAPQVMAIPVRSRWTKRVA